MERKFHVVFTGRLHEGFKHADTVEKMVSLFQLDREKVTKLLYSGRPTILKQELNWEQARKYHDNLQRIGLQIKITEAETPPPQPPASPPLSPPADPVPEIPAQACREDKSPAQSTLEETPSPPSPLDNADTSSSDENAAPPFRVENSHGWLWIKEAFGMFFRQPLTWIAVMLLFLVFIAIPIAIHPYLGGLLSIVLAQVFHGGLMLGAQHQKEEGKLRIVHLFLGFRHNLFQLLLASVFTLLILLPLAASIILYTGKIPLLTIPPEFSMKIIVLLREYPFYLGGLFAAVTIFLPLMMGYWFTPCLAALDDRSAMAGFRLSFRAVKMNAMAFFIYVLVFLLLGMLLLFLFGAIAALFSFLLGSEHFFLFTLLPPLYMILFVLPFTALIPLSIYTGYRDIFHGPNKQPENG